MAAGLVTPAQLHPPTVQPVQTSRWRRGTGAGSVLADAELSAQDQQKLGNLVLSGGALYVSGVYNSTYMAVLEAHERAVKRSAEGSST